MEANNTSLVARSQQGVWSELGLSQQQKKINGFGRHSMKPFHEASANHRKIHFPQPVHAQTSQDLRRPFRD